MAENKNRFGTVLVLAPDGEQGEFLREILGRDCFLTISSDFEEVVRGDAARGVDLVILDSELAQLSRIAPLLDERGMLSGAAVLFLARGEEDLIQGLEMGVSECVMRSAKPGLVRAKVRQVARLKEWQDRLAESERAARKRVRDVENLIQMVAHDLKSPAIAIHGLVKLLERKFCRMQPDRKRDEILLFLTRASKSIQDFLNDLGQLMTLERFELDLVEVSLEEAVEEVMNRHQDLLEERNLSLTVDFGDCSALVIADRRRMIQVFDNLIVNAVRHMGDIADPMIRIQGCESSDCVVVSVVDNGIGIPLEYHEKIFSRFFRVPGKGSKGGTGLGLSIVKAIIESHGGRVWVESECGKGTAFKFTLPKSTCRTSPRLNADQPVSRDAAGKAYL